MILRIEAVGRVTQSADAETLRAGVAQAQEMEYTSLVVELGVAALQAVRDALEIQSLQQINTELTTQNQALQDDLGGTVRRMSSLKIELEAERDSAVQAREAELQSEIARLRQVTRRRFLVYGIVVNVVAESPDVIVID